MIFITWDSFGARIAAVILPPAILIPLVWLTIRFSCEKVILDRYGIEYNYLRRNYFIKWEEIKTVGTAYMPSETARYGDPLGKPWIYFNAENTRYYFSITRKMKSEKFLFLYYGDEIYEEIKKYWHGEFVFG
jgi:hypothetical protein